MKQIYLLSILLLITFTSCKKDDDNGGGGGTPEPTYKPTPYTYQRPVGFFTQQIPVNPDNPLTVEGVALGRRLFYDPILSGNNTQSCASCHSLKWGLTDNGLAFSKGIDGSIGTRNSMPLFNIVFSKTFLWDGGAANLESQIFNPITSPIEMNQDLAELVKELQAHAEYPALFKKAFGTDSITTQALARALAQFMKTILSGNTVFDYNNMTDAQFRGFEVFLSENKGDCFHCHINGPTFTDFDFKNNGLDAVPADKGRERITGDPNDRGKFKTPSLRNLVFTPPYMHDGRFNTLREVVDFYDTGIVWSATIDPNIAKHFDINKEPIPRMTEQDKNDLIEFLKALTDSTLLTNPAYSSPF